jgi:hypothetical protein
MPGLDPGIHDSLALRQHVDGRAKPGHDGNAVWPRHCDNHNPSTALVMMLRWISLEPP